MAPLTIELRGHPAAVLGVGRVEVVMGRESTGGDVVRRVSACHPGLGVRLLSEDGTPRRSTLLLVDGERCTSWTATFKPDAQLTLVAAVPCDG